MCICENHQRVSQAIVHFIRRRGHALPGTIYRYLFREFSLSEYVGEQYLRELSARGIVDTDPPYFILRERSKAGTIQDNLLGLLMASAGSAGGIV